LSPFLAKQRYFQVSRLLSEKETILDLGCGAGGFKDYLPAETNYYGIDLVKHWPNDRKNLYVGGLGDDLPKELKNIKFTVITALAIIEHLKKPEILFRDAGNQLESGGKVILTTPHPLGRKMHDFGSKIGLFSNHASHEHETFLDKDDLKRFASSEGFEMISYRRFLFGMNQVAVFKKL
jgi:2-polyprenyl-3-methyl-5-hydroxy-6-metoxy-1,4-benzoquinol methylase